MRKKLSCLPVSIYPLMASGEISIVQWSQEAEKIGFDYFDLGESAVAGLSEDQLKSMRGKCALPFNMLSAYTDFTHPDRGVRRESVAAAKEKIRKTAALGGKFIRLPGGAAHDEALADTKEAINNMCACFEECIKEADKYGIRIVFENDSKPPTWKRPNFCFDIGRFLNTWEELKKLSVGFNYDTGNAFFLEDWRTILDAVLDRLESLHITDYNYKNGNLKTTVFGEGTVPIKEMLTIIKDSGFDGMISMEDATFQGLKGTARSYAYVRRICDEIFSK
ncbi:MAG TPA: sugar phosphate isomerase/epimerase [Candidatus Copromorpha excrementigallinarum]|uniref:Sugar phosphate isomerase/epimerase n=1 Tax=Candidatus Allocopromorpha excrementigallinarum TaxID=2840742 RepID=A0A9D1I0L3_9FIRM|nr:sugar phosphate isomerase/epimerase [Candidatus Copromorpha excrementigallinarum]